MKQFLSYQNADCINSCNPIKQNKLNLTDMVSVIIQRPNEVNAVFDSIISDLDAD